MRHTVTPKTREIVKDLHRMAESIVPHLGLVSAEARGEWNAVRALWPSDDELREGALEISLADLESMQAKVARFGEILRSLPSYFSTEEIAAAGDEAGPARRAAA